MPPNVDVRDLPVDACGDAALLTDATRDLLADLVGVVVMGTSMEQLGAYAEQGECLVALACGLVGRQQSYKRAKEPAWPWRRGARYEQLVVSTAVIQ